MIKRSEPFPFQLHSSILQKSWVWFFYYMTFPLLVFRALWVSASYSSCEKETALGVSSPPVPCVFLLSDSVRRNRQLSFFEGRMGACRGDGSAHVLGFSAQQSGAKWETHRPRDLRLTGFSLLCVTRELPREAAS